MTVLTVMSTQRWTHGEKYWPSPRRTLKILPPLKSCHLGETPASQVGSPQLLRRWHWSQLSVINCLLHHRPSHHTHIFVTGGNSSNLRVWLNLNLVTFTSLWMSYVRCSDRLVVSLQRCLISAFSGAPPPPPPSPSDAHKLSFCYQQFTSSYHRHLSQIKLDNNLCNCYITRRLPPFIWEVFYGNSPIRLETNWTEDGRIHSCFISCEQHYCAP